MDDPNGGAQSTKEGFEFWSKSRFSEATFNIRKWRTNDPELRKWMHDYKNREVANIYCHVNSKVPKYVNTVSTMTKFWDFIGIIREMLLV